MGWAMIVNEVCQFQATCLEAATPDQWRRGITTSDAGRRPGCTWRGPLREMRSDADRDLARHYQEHSAAWEEYNRRLDDDYLATCASAATAQGLDPATEALRRHGLSCEVRQTGGMVMVLTVVGPDGSSRLGITRADVETEDEGDAPRYFVCRYAHAEDEGEPVAADALVTELVSIAADFLGRRL